MLLLCFLTTAIVAQAQTTDTPKVKKEAEVWTAVDQLPQFPGGTEKLFRFIDKNLKYPKEDKKNGVQGKVIVTFIVAADGALTDLKIAKALSPGCDAEALRVMALSPKWIPGSAAGKPCPVNYTLPIMFTL